MSRDRLAERSEKLTVSNVIALRKRLKLFGKKELEVPGGGGDFSGVMGENHENF